MSEEGLAVDKYELKVSMDEIDRLIAERRFAEAADIADTIDWTRVKGVQVLCRISDLYKINKRYKDSRDLMEIAYERKPSSRKIIYSLCELELKLNNYIHALQLYNAFINVAPRDPDRFVLQYKLYKKQDVNVYEQIAVLEEYLQHEFRDRWAYELAALYLRAGEEQQCIRQCDEIVAYYGEGRFVIRALELKKSLTQLTPQQEERLEILKNGGTIMPAAPAEEESAQDTQEPVSQEAGVKAREAEEAQDAAADAVQEAAETAAEALSGTKAVAAGEDAEDASETDYTAPEEQQPVAEAEESEEGTEASANPEAYTDDLLHEVNMEETIARGMREIGDYDSVLAQETSGQLAMVMEEEPVAETQVDGQLDLAQIMSEWEKIRKDSEQQRLAEARRRVLERSDAAKRELYGDDYVSEETSDLQTQDKTGTTRSWKKEDVENGLKQKNSR